VLAEATAANAAGVRAMNDHANGVGVDGSSQKGTALRGLSTSGTCLYAESLTGRVIDASTLGQTDPAIDVYAPGTIAVYAKSVLAPGVEAFGRTGVKATSLSALDPNDPPKGAAVFGGTVSGNGVYGSSAAGVGVAGVGLEVAGGWAGAFFGRVIVHGTIYKHCCQFSIDHPLDPRNKVLNHVSVEASEHKTFYDGTVRLNAQGRASVRLPRWFEALNALGSLRYQLTPLGAPAPDLHVARGVKQGVFVIAGGRAGQRICWQVTGVRRDRYARTHPVVVEQRKRDVRPSTPEPSAAQVRKLGRDLAAQARRIKRDLDRRERVARARRLPGPLKQAPIPEIEHDHDAVNRLIEEAVALGRRAIGGKRSLDRLTSVPGRTKRTGPRRRK
jgi:hypothetical protein